MSKVIKKSGDFIPERIIPKDFNAAPTWGNLVKEIELEDDIPLHVDTQEDSPTDTAAGTQPFDLDFSAPEHSSTGAEAHPKPDLSESSSPQNMPGKYSQEDMDAAVEDSYDKGVQAGMERMESDYGVSIKTLQSMCEQLNTIRETILKNSLSEMRDLVLLISEKIIRHSVESQKETIIRTVEDAIQQAVKSDEFVITVNPDDYITIKTKSADFISSVSGLENIIVRSDASVDKGGCMIESSNCTVDATLVSQLEIIAESLQEN